MRRRSSTCCCYCGPIFRYRRVALRCHPDKVPHPKAKEAFQKLSEAFDCLHDDVQQAMYIEKLRDRVEAAKIRAKKKAARMKRKQWNKPKTNACVHVCVRACFAGVRARFRERAWSNLCADCSNRYRHTAAGAAGAAGATSGGAAAAGSSGKAKKRKKQSKQAGKGGASGPKKWYEKTRSWIEVRLCAREFVSVCPPLHCCFCFLHPTRERFTTSQCTLSPTLQRAWPPENAGLL